MKTKHLLNLFFLMVPCIGCTNKDCNRFTKATLRPQCPYPFKEVGQDCYFLSSVTRNFDEAQRYCLGLGGNLATPDRPYALYTYIAEQPAVEHWWVGAKYASVRQRFEYITDQTPLDRELWHPTLPEARPGSHCVYLHPNNLRPWTNFPCTNVYYFVCQYC